MSIGRVGKIRVRIEGFGFLSGFVFGFGFWVRLLFLLPSPELGFSVRAKSEVSTKTVESHNPCALSSFVSIHVTNQNINNSMGFKFQFHFIGTVFDIVLVLLRDS